MDDLGYDKEDDRKEQCQSDGWCPSCLLPAATLEKANPLQMKGKVFFGRMRKGIIDKPLSHTFYHSRCFQEMLNKMTFTSPLLLLWLAQAGDSSLPYTEYR